MENVMLSTDCVIAEPDLVIMAKFVDGVTEPLAAVRLLDNGALESADDYGSTRFSVDDDLKVYYNGKACTPGILHMYLADKA